MMNIKHCDISAEPFFLILTPMDPSGDCHPTLGIVGAGPWRLWDFVMLCDSLTS